MNPESQAQALEAIYEEVTKLLQRDYPEEIKECLERIRSLARYGFDLRTDVEVEVRGRE